MFKTCTLRYAMMYYRMITYRPLRAIIMMTMLRHCRITILRHCRILINIAWAYGPSLCKLTHTLKHIGLRANFMEEHNTRRMYSTSTSTSHLRAIFIGSWWRSTVLLCGVQKNVSSICRHINLNFPVACRILIIYSPVYHLQRN